MALNLRHGGDQGSLPFSAMDAMSMFSSIAAALAEANGTKAQGAKVGTFLAALHKSGFTVTPVPMFEADHVMLDYQPSEVGQGNQS